MACLHSSLCSVLVDWFQLVPEHHCDGRLSTSDGTTSGHDVGRLGNEARQTKLGLESPSITGELLGKLTENGFHRKNCSFSGSSLCASLIVDLGNLGVEMSERFIFGLG